MAGVGHDLEVLHRRDEALLLLLEVARVEMRGERCRGLLRHSLALVEQSAAADGEGRTCRWDGGQQFPSCGHVYVLRALKDPG
jgi:hypothetical protein